MATLSILSLYNYQPAIFDGFRVPDPLDKQTVIDELCFQLAELSLVYPEPETMQQAITVFTNIHYKEWSDLQETLEYEYNPIWNVDGVTLETRNLSSKRDKRGSDTIRQTGSDTSQAGGSDTSRAGGSDANQASGSDTTVHSTAAFNESTFTNREQEQTTYGRKDTATYGRTDTATYGRTDTVTYGKTDTTSYASGEDGKDTGTIETLRQGNIGVTKTQELIEAQREVVQFTVTDFIIRQFKRKFCVMIY